MLSTEPHPWTRLQRRREHATPEEDHAKERRAAVGLAPSGSRDHPPRCTGVISGSGHMYSMPVEPKKVSARRGRHPRTPYSGSSGWNRFILGNLSPFGGSRNLDLDFLRGNGTQPHTASSGATPPDVLPIAGMLGGRAPSAGHCMPIRDTIGIIKDTTIPTIGLPMDQAAREQDPGRDQVWVLPGHRQQARESRQVPSSLPIAL